jgi:hypothetical protein
MENCRATFSIFANSQKQQIVLVSENRKVSVFIPAEMKSFLERDSHYGRIKLTIDFLIEGPLACEEPAFEGVYAVQT